jgi:hypothetical protein
MAPIVKCASSTKDEWYGPYCEIHNAPLKHGSRCCEAASEELIRLRSENLKLRRMLRGGMK